MPLKIKAGEAFRKVRPYCGSWYTVLQVVPTLSGDVVILKNASVRSSDYRKIKVIKRSTLSCDYSRN